MAVKDRYGNNIRRSDRVKDLRPETDHDEGTAVGTYGLQVAVNWDNGEEEQVRATDLRVQGRSMR